MRASLFWLKTMIQLIYTLKSRRKRSLSIKQGTRKSTLITTLTQGLICILIHKFRNLKAHQTQNLLSQEVKIQTRCKLVATQCQINHHRISNGYPLGTLSTKTLQRNSAIEIWRNLTTTSTFCFQNITSSMPR